MITYWIGGRELEDARQMLKDLAGRCVGKPLFVSDELFHQLIPAEPTGKPGHPRNPHKVIDADLDYATVHKTRQGGKVIKVERDVIHGSEPRILERLKNSPSQVIKTAYVERSNLDWRLWDAHLARKSPTAARSLRWLKAKFAICVACYNLIGHTQHSAEARIVSFARKHQPWQQILPITSGLSRSCWLARSRVNDMVTLPIFSCGLKMANLPRN